MIHAKPVKMNLQKEVVIDLGFSGSRLGMSQIQKDAFRKILEGKTGTFHHGDCIGADSEAHDIAREFTDKWRIIIHPPLKNEFRAFKLGDEIWPQASYYERNRQIVLCCNTFIAMPKSREQVGGTWYTINYFRECLAWEINQKKPLTRTGHVILPSGEVGEIQKKPRYG